MVNDRPRVSIIVISYNTREMTLECVRSVRAQTTISNEIIVLDNLSTDGSPQAIKAEFTDIKLLNEQTNHGFAKGNNIAAQHARAEYLLLLNPDTVVLDGAVDKLVAFADRTPSARIWGGRTVFADGTLNPTSCWRKMGLWTIICRSTGLTGLFPKSEWLNPEAYGGWDRATERQVDIVTGCFFLIRREDWEALGGFDETFFMYGEEADLCLRAASELGARPRVTPQATIIHYGGASEKVRSDRVVSVLRAKGELLKRHTPAWQRPLAKPLFAMFPFSRKLAAQIGLIGKRGEGASVWHDVWVRRAEWLNGF
ncbi:glycosyltransferase family 2 protein [uncultured Aliiroseovarius sp.]|uniref:glycosyltransferase family 2 protein n=1 Tax=uncultured Aliiroseovarius sp. TaxID=1658783 RepID=UPI002597797C|nr:glycosyltransferase family 2 protein [uncultured Aliiroseovarius sp.]